jgi:two-component sensor histidine kinase
VLVNELFANALKHGKGDVELSLGVEGDRVRLVVSDHGPGFPEGFAPHEAAHVGLDLVSSLGCWDLQGEISFRNGPSGGAQVTVEFAVPPGAAQPAAPDPYDI